MPDPMRQSLQYVWQTRQDAWTLDLGVRAAQPASRIQALVDLMAITTVLDEEGRCAYGVNIALQNRSEQFLGVRIPAGLRLMSAVVAGEAVDTREGLLITG